MDGRPLGEAGPLQGWDGGGWMGYHWQSQVPSRDGLGVDGWETTGRVRSPPGLGWGWMEGDHWESREVALFFSAARVQTLRLSVLAFTQ